MHDETLQLENCVCLGLNGDILRSRTFEGPNAFVLTIEWPIPFIAEVLYLDELQ